MAKLHVFPLLSHIKDLSPHSLVLFNTRLVVFFFFFVYITTNPLFSIPVYHFLTGVWVISYLCQSYFKTVIPMSATLLAKTHCPYLVMFILLPSSPKNQSCGCKSFCQHQLYNLLLTLYLPYPNKICLSNTIDAHTEKLQGVTL